MKTHSVNNRTEIEQNLEPNKQESEYKTSDQVRVDPRVQYNFIYFRPGAFESEQVLNYGQISGYNLVFKNKDSYEEVNDIISWLSKP